MDRNCGEELSGNFEGVFRWVTNGSNERIDLKKEEPEEGSG